jgi:hypothetical protein
MVLRPATLVRNPPAHHLHGILNLLPVQSNDLLLVLQDALHQLPMLMLKLLLLFCTWPIIPVPLILYKACATSNTTRVARVPAAAGDIAAASWWSPLLQYVVLLGNGLLLLLLGHGAWIAQAKHVLRTARHVAAVGARARGAVHTSPLCCCIVHLISRGNATRGTLSTVLAQLCMKVRRCNSRGAGVISVDTNMQDMASPYTALNSCSSLEDALNYVPTSTPSLLHSAVSTKTIQQPCQTVAVAVKVLVSYSCLPLTRSA